MKILNTIEQFSERAKPILAQAGEVKYMVPPQEALIEALDGVDAAVVGLGLQFSKEVLELSPSLMYLATATTGLTHIDTEYAKERGIQIVSLRGEDEFLDTITSTAELAFGLLIDLMRFTPFAFDSIRRYEFTREAFRGGSLYGKTLGIIGMGRLGKILARGAEGFRMNIQFYDPHVSQQAFPKYKKVELDELLATSDAVSLHLHLLPETSGFLNRDRIFSMKQGAYLINTSRGELVDEQVIVDALTKGHLGGYATDVLSDEGTAMFNLSGNPLVEYAKKNRNCVIVPHTGGLTSDSREATDIFIAKKLVAVVAGSK